MKAIRRMSLCEYSVLATKGEINSMTAPFAVMDKDRDQSDCLPPTVPIGSLMLWVGEEPYFSFGFGRVTVTFEIPDDEIAWSGMGRYGSWIERYDYARNYSWKEYQEEYYKEIAVMNLKLEWVTGVETIIDFDDSFSYPKEGGKCEGYNLDCYKYEKEGVTCQPCLELTYKELVRMHGEF